MQSENQLGALDLALVVRFCMTKNNLNAKCKMLTRASVEVPHEHLADPPGGIPGAGVGRRKGGNSGGLAYCKVTTAPLFEFCLKFNI